MKTTQVIEAAKRFSKPYRITNGKKFGPKECVTKGIWDERFEDIRSFERYLTRNGTVVRKFFLHVSKDELPRTAR